MADHIDTFLNTALHYAARGWYVFPLVPRDKFPRIAKKDGGKGYLDATRDPTQIRTWWAAWPDANVGIATGASGLVVIDIDPGKGGDESWASMRQRFEIDVDTVTSLTGGGGQHLVFAALEGKNIGNSTGKEGKLGTGVDIRATGGYIVAPPSIHPDGPRYVWEVSGHPDEKSLLPFPTCLLPFVNLDGRVAAMEADRSGADPLPKTIKAGTRNSTLTSLAGSMRRRSMTGLEILDALESVNTRRCDPPLPHTELEKIAESVAQYAPSTKAATYRMTDMGNAERLVARHGHDLRYCHPWHKWYVWDGKKWAGDDTAAIRRKAKETARSIYQEAGQTNNGDDRKSLARWAIKTESNSKIKDMLESAQSELPILPDDLDTATWLLNCQNGTLDLKTCLLKEHDRADLITRIVPTVYDSGADAPLWDAFLNRIMAGNQTLITFLQRAVGYSLTGFCEEHDIFFLHGTGDNGKSTFLEVLRAVLGDYAMATPATTLLTKRGGSIPNDIARLKGARFVTATEIGKGRRLDEATVKVMTGGDKITARFMRAEWFEFKPEFVFWLGTNNKPSVRETANAIWNRIKLIPFTVTIPKPEQDQGLKDRLLHELPGILAWAVRGCMDWQDHGLTPPTEVLVAIDEYREEMDTVGGFIDDECVLGPQEQVAFAPLYTAYKEWCDESNERAETKTALGLELTNRGFPRVYIGRAKGRGGLTLSALAYDHVQAPLQPVQPV